MLLKFVLSFAYFLLKKNSLEKLITG